MLVALEQQFGETTREGRATVTIAPTITNNRENGAALNKLMTTKFPASALLMELLCCMKQMRSRTVVEWTPRVGNSEADKLANGVFDGFSPTMRIPVNASSLEWEILPQALIAGRTAEERFRGGKLSGLPDKERCRNARR